MSGNPCSLHVDRAARSRVLSFQNNTYAPRRALKHHHGFMPYFGVQPRDYVSNSFINLLHHDLFTFLISFRFTFLWKIPSLKIHSPIVARIKAKQQVEKVDDTGSKGAADCVLPGCVHDVCVKLSGLST